MPDGMSSLELAAEIARLALLSPLQYDRERIAAAERLGVRVATLDEEVTAARRSASNSGEHDHPQVPVPPAFTDEALALRFTDLHKDRLRYVAAWGRWYLWNGATWHPDETMLAFDLARTICREASAECNDDSVASTVAAARTVAAVERLAKADRSHAATVDQWDADPWLLNTPGGVVDLRTGRMRSHRPGDYLTKVTAVTPGGECPLWLSVLEKVTNNDTDLQVFIQRVVGYSLTGSIREHALFFAFGTGANGKGVVINTITGIMNTYATVASIDVFTASQTDRHPTDLAMLRGARLVTAQETEEGRRWAEARIKAMTGGDPITARFMRQDFFTFEPRFKLLIAGNHKPGLRNIDEAIRRRFNLIPFAVKIPVAERDQNLPEKLRAEWPGILKWAIQGCLDWQQQGLSPPKAVRDATAEYLDAEDALGLWIAECCTTDSSLHGSATELFNSWRDWAEAAGEQPGSQRRFTQAMNSRGFASKRMELTNKAGLLGIGPPVASSGANYGRD